MYKKLLRYSIITIISMLALSSCSNTRYLADEESLFVGGDIKVMDTTLSRKEKNNIKTYLSASIRPKPNATFLGLRWKLYLYNIVGEPRRETGGFRNWVREKVGEPPVLASTMNLTTNNQIFINQLQNIGYFNADVTSTKETRNQRTKAYFNVWAREQYKINEVKFPLDDGDITRIAHDIEQTKEKTLLKKDNPYNLEVIKNERVRIDAELKNNGYYFFNPEYFLVRVDTGVGQARVNLTVQLKWDDMPRNAYERFTVKDVIIIPNYRLQTGRDTSTYKRVPKASDTLIIFNDIKMVEPLRLTSRKSKRPKRSYRPQTFYQAMQLKPGAIYNQRDHNLSLNRLVNMGTFKFVKSDIVQIRNTPSSSDSVSDTALRFRYDPVNMGDEPDAALRVSYFLTPYPKKSLDGDVSGFTQNDSRAGSRASISWRNRNTLRGGELFTIKASGGFEVQYGSSGQNRRPNTYNAGLGVGLNIPRFLVPVIKVKPSGTFVPRTLINLDYNYSRRGNLYTINSLTMGWGYNWKEDILRDHKLFPISIGIVRTDTLSKLSNFDYNLSNLVFNGIILGSTYEYIFNSKANNNTRKNNYFVSVNADVAGNLLGLINGTTSLQQESKKIFGSPYAQYGKLQTDFRFYHRINPKLELATRVIVGVGIPYGNSYTLPNVKQFFSGGSNSLRGFPSRLVGPGTYDFRNGKYIETLGDMKFEWSLEARQKLYRFIDLGIFVDAGNIWLLRENENFPGGKISGDFYKELAISAGLGLRLDFSILILRLDFAGPLRKPYMPEKERWQFSQFNLLDGKWRNENIFFNLAIGLPF